MLHAMDENPLEGPSWFYAKKRKKKPTINTLESRKSVRLVLETYSDDDDDDDEAVGDELSTFPQKSRNSSPNIIEQPKISLSPKVSLPLLIVNDKDISFPCVSRRKKLQKTTKKKISDYLEHGLKNCEILPQDTAKNCNLSTTQLNQEFLDKTNLGDASMDLNKLFIPSQAPVACHLENSSQSPNNSCVLCDKDLTANLARAKNLNPYVLANSLPITKAKKKKKINLQ